ncbi:heat shock factor protein 2-like isoform X1 [Bufo gargarizans]|uniref:heat shock factor protein 2-like isoform X1 n=1 Tax=Bufo gargarizans TaxID=30331 RepID=UPI001CF57DAA|nr:heat shock factor protein 2-like isoform X1 [Bufo gargarizans]
MKASSSVPKFLTKIWALVEDHRNAEYICWSQDGNSFIVLDEERFAKEILPRHFKHNNMASFVRQLNWYGFHKVMQDDTGAARHDKYCSGRYQHHFFKRGHEELLTKIKRKVTASTGDKRVFRKAKVSVPRIESVEEGKTGPDDMQKILTFLHQLQARQDILDTAVESLKRENEALWKEVLQLRPAQPQFETVTASQSFEQIATLQTSQPLMIDSTGNYNQLAMSKTPQNADQAYDNRSAWSTDRKSSRGTKRSMRDDPDSSTEEHNNEMLKISIPHDYESYQTDESDDLSDLSSCDSEEIVNEESASNHSHSFIKTPDKQPVTRKRMKNGTEKHIVVTKHRVEYSDSEEDEDVKNHYGESGPSKKTDKTCRTSCAKMGRTLKRIHRDNTLLNEKVLAVEQQSLQKLSEISTVLTTLANYMMNVQNSQRPTRSTSLDATKINFNSQRHGLFSDATKKEYDS